MSIPGKIRAAICLTLGAAIWALPTTSAARAQTVIVPEVTTQIPSANPAIAAQLSGALQEGQGVMDRARPEYDAVGIPLGGFRLYPALAADLSSDDNILDTPHGTNDLFWTISPRFDLRSNWTSDALQFYGQLNHFAYDSYQPESRTDWILGGVSRLDLAPDSFFDSDVSFLSTHESRISPDLSVLALSPTHYDDLHADSTATSQWNRISLSATLNFDRYDYDPTKLIGGGTIDNNDRDRNAYQLTGKASYEVAPSHSFFVQFTYDKRDFDLLLDRYGFDRNSDGYRLDIGTAMMVTPLIRATGYVGYLQQNYVAPLHNASGLDFNGQIDWFVTELLTTHLTASRTIDDTTIPNASSMDVRSGGASADYELLRNLLLQANVTYTNYAFDGVARDDKITTVGFGGKYLINRHLSFNANYTLQQRTTNVADSNFSDNLFTIGILGQY